MAKRLKVVKREANRDQGRSSFCMRTWDKSYDVRFKKKLLPTSQTYAKTILSSEHSVYKWKILKVLT